MDALVAELDRLSRRDRSALRRLLIAATAAAGRNDPGAELSSLVRGSPLATLPSAAALHRISGTVLRGLEGVEHVPDAVRAALGSDAQRASLHHLLIAGALGEITAAFDALELRWVVMKGPEVASLLYPDAGDRTYADVDLLVDQRDYAPAMHVLEEFGYTHAIRNWALAEEMMAGQVTMKSPTVSIDLHWHLHYSAEDRRQFALDPEAMIERCERRRVSGVVVPVFDPVDRLLTLAFHAARSGGHRLVWLKDVERSLTVESPDVDELIHRSRTARCGPPVGIILGRAAALLAAPVPQAVVDELTPGPVRVVDRWLSSLTHPIQFHERNTITRAFTRSVRSSVSATVREIPGRGVRTLRRAIAPARPNETDDPVQKERYLRAVATSGRPPS